MDFLWHAVSDSEKESIKKEAKRIMDSFAKALSKVDNAKEDNLVVRAEQKRKEEKEQECDESFRKMFFNNAPEKDDEFILAEKGKWKE